MIIAKLHLPDSPIMDYQVEVIPGDRCLSHMYDTLHISLGSSQIIYFYVSQFQLDFICLMTWEMVMVNNNSELTFSELSTFSLDSPARLLTEIVSNKNMFTSSC